ncbi:MAG: hypothetical protein AAGB31_12790 [Bdellovibrio sp.]
MADDKVNNIDKWTEPVVLEGRKLILEPLGPEHLDNLERNLLSKHAWHCVHWNTRTRTDLDKWIIRSQQVRNSSVLADGRKRDYKVYSIIDSEWPNVKATLNWYLDKHV